MTKYLSFDYFTINAVTGPEVTFADRTTLLPRARETVHGVQLLTRETPDFIIPTL